MLLDLISDPAEYLRARRAGSLEDAARAAALKEALVCETHSAALMTATVTSAVNALADKTLRIGPTELKTFAPGDGSRLSMLQGLLLEADATLDEPIFLGQFLTGAATGHELLKCYYRDAEMLGAARAGVLHKTTLSETWREICHLAILAVRELDAHIAPDLPEIYVQNARVLTALLAGAKNGWRPCIDSHGHLHLPPLPQQRRWPRRALLQTCKVAKRDMAFEAFVRDVSAGGLGLDKMPPVARGEHLSVELVCGRQLRGIVAWSSGAKAGLHFQTELKATDPLLV